MGRTSPPTIRISSSVEAIPGLERIVRLGPEADERVAEVDHPLGDVGVMVEGQDDRHRGSDHVASDRLEPALDVVDALG